MPSHIRVDFPGSRISVTHLPFRGRIPRKEGCFPPRVVLDVAAVGRGEGGGVPLVWVGRAGALKVVGPIVVGLQVARAKFPRP